jgi:hypothetical protein
MSKVEISVPDTLFYQLQSMAMKEGVSLEQYIVFALTRQTMLTPAIHKVPKKDVERQCKDFTERMKRLGKSSPEELEKTLRERERVEPEPDLNPEIVARLEQRIAEAKNGP